MEHKIEALGRYFSAILMRDYLDAIPDGSYHYIETHPARHFSRLLCLALLQAMAMWLSGTMAAAAAVYVEIYYVTSLVLAAIVWKRSGYSLISYAILNAASVAILWGILM